MTIKFNGTVISNYTFSVSNVVSSQNLVQGDNIFEIKASNIDGIDTKV